MNNLEEAAANRETFSIVVYHVMDAKGTHRFLSMDALSVDDLGGAEAVEAMLARQFKSVELLGSATVATSPDNPAHWEPLDRPDEINPLWERLMRAKSARRY